MPRSPGACAAAGAALLLACLTPRGPETPAVIVNPTPESRAALGEAVAEALNGASVALADDALTRTSLLVVDRAPARDPSGRRLNGRELGTPERFTLVASGSRCILVHERSGKRFRLADTTCSPR